MNRQTQNQKESSGATLFLVFPNSIQGFVIKTKQEIFESVVKQHFQKSLVWFLRK